MTKPALCISAVKKVLSFSLVFVLILSALPLHVFSAVPTHDEGWCGDDLFWEYDLSTETLTVSGTGKTWNYYSDSMRPWNSYLARVRHLVISEGCTGIGDGVFQIMTAISTVELPNSLLSIGDGAFTGCISLVELTIPDSVKLLGENCFSHCNKLRRVTVGGGLSSISKGAFAQCSSLVEIELSENLKTVGVSSFSSCTSLTDIYLPFVESYDTNAFSNCSALKSFTFGENVETVGDGVFYNCTSLSTIEFLGTPSSVSYSFAEKTPWFNEMEDGYYTVADGRVLARKGSATGITSFEIPDGVEEITKNCFSGEPELSNVTIPSSVKEIRDYAFFNLPKLKNVTVPASVEYIGSKNFGWLQNVENNYDFFDPNTVISSPPGATAAKEYSYSYGFTFRCIHDFKDVTVMEDCTKGGFLYSECPCGYVREKTPIAPAEHDISVTDKKTTCTEDGLYKEECLVCGTVISEKVESALGHKEKSNYEVIALPTCTQDGLLCKKCSVCDEITSKKTAPMIGHTPSKNRSVTPATCTEDGCEASVCTVCGETYDELILPMTGHSPSDEWVTVTLDDATVGVPGLKMRYCSDCEETVDFEWYYGTEAADIGASEVIATLRCDLSGKLAVRSCALDLDGDGSVEIKDLLFAEKIDRRASSARSK